MMVSGIISVIWNGTEIKCIELTETKTGTT